jgi:hypothetical protein
MRVLTVLQQELGFGTVPHWTTIRQWVLKKGYHQIIHGTLEQAKDWGAIFDLTVDVGSLKCLLILGVQFSRLQARGNFTLAHSDVQVLGIYFTTTSSGAFVNQSLKDAEKKIGHPFKFLLLDQGSDVTKGADIYSKDSKTTVVVHDISHKIANVLEKKLKNDSHWQEFCKRLTATKLEVQQTNDLSALMPPKLRSKARYMSADVLMDWVIRFQNSKKSGHMDSISQERFNQYFGWLAALEPHIEDWKQMVAIGETIKEIVRIHGFSHKTNEKLEDLVNDQFTHASAKVVDFIDAAMNAVWDEVEQLKPRQIVLGDSRVIESIFGKFKQSSSSQLQGITIGALGIATFMASNEMEDVKKAMEITSIGQVIEWGKKHIGNSLASIRRKFFPHKKRNENEGNYVGAVYA